MNTVARIEVDENLCKGCEMCANACPKKLIELDKTKLNAKGYHPAKLTDGEKCTGCKACATMCPDVAITVYR
ncbi:MAG: 4Fe-4S binding protein [Acutalibacteraceae bacterium]|nr:4Fe-4S binding protein [Acutalibacteraceae bacterium]